MPFVVFLNLCLSRTDPPAKTELQRSNNCGLFRAARLPDGWEETQPSLPLPGSGECWRKSAHRVLKLRGQGTRCAMAVIPCPGWDVRGQLRGHGPTSLCPLPMVHGGRWGCHTLGWGHAQPKAPCPQAGPESRGCH